MHEGGGHFGTSSFRLTDIVWGLIHGTTLHDSIGKRSDCFSGSIWRSARTCRDTSRESDRIRSQSSPNRVRRTQHNPSPASLSR